MGALKLTACMKVVSEMSDLDRDALLDRLDGYLDDGVPKERAQVMAASDMLAELEDERREFMRMLKEQHPEIFVVTAPEIRQSADRITDTPEFKRWFGSSKVVDADGQPLVVYHGSPVVDFNVFDLEKVNANDPDGPYNGFWFSTEEQSALQSGKFPWGRPNAADAQVRSFYLSMQNPATRQQARKVAREIEDDWRELYPSARSLQDAARLELMTRGFDGVVHSKPIQMTDELRRRIDAAADGEQVPVGKGTYSIARDGDAEYSLWSESVGKITSYDSAEDALGAVSEGIFVAFRPEQIKSAIGNSGAFATDNPDIRRSADRTPLGFYSALARSIDGVPIKSAPAGAWKTAIKGLLNKGAIKQDELEWSGLEDWMDLQQGKISKEQVAEYLKQGGVKVEETVLSDAAVRALPEGWYVEEFKGANLGDMRFIIYDQDDERVGNGATYEEALDDAIDEDAYADDPRAPRYNEYTLPGGENYREVLLTLPMSKVPSYAEITEFAKRWAQEEFDRRGTRFADDQEFVDAMKDDIWAWNDLWSEAAIKHFGLKDTGRLRPYGYGSSRTTDAKPADMYESKHWDQPDVLAHIRVNDRTDADGKRVLFVEELQSDWGQEGKKSGFKGPDMTPADKSRWSELTIKDRNRGLTTEEQAELDRLQPLADAAQRQIPAAPFVTKTEGWLNLALKRVMVMAAEGGYDKVAFVNGEQSADRYDLSNKVNYIQWNPGYGANRRLVTLEMSDGKELGLTVQDGVVEDSSIGADGKPLEDVLGKEIAKKILAAESGNLRGLELKVGGEGMKTFYDTIVPTALKKLLPKVGGGQIATVEVKRPAGPKVPGKVSSPRYWEQPGFDVTDAMREKVAGGLPLFSRDRNSDATWTNDRIDFLLDDMAYTDGRTKGYAAWVNPQDFVAATTGSIEEMGEVAKEAGPLRMNDLRQNGLPPRLYVESGRWEISGHEGRHRMSAMAAAGVKRAPVLLVMRQGGLTTGDNYKPLASRRLDGQVFKQEGGGTEYGESITVTDLTPITYENAGVLRQKFGGESGVQFSPDRAQTQTPEFKNWFGDSKVVDENGKPLVVYRGQRRVAKPDKFVTTRSRENPSFAADPAVASVYSRQLETQQYGAGSNVMPVYLSIKKPLDIRSLGEQVSLEDIVRRLNWDWSVSSGLGDYEKSLGYGDLADALRSMDFLAERTGARFNIEASDEDGFRIDSFEDLANYIQQRGDKEDFDSIDLAIMDTTFDAYMIGDSADWTYLLSELGFDGVFHKDVFDVGARYYEGDKSKLEEGYEGGPVHDTYRPFEQTQIKSAIGNRGTFDSTNPDIRFTPDRAQIETPEFKKWFGKSKVVNGIGKPRVVYHGTAGDVAIFDMGRAGQTYGLKDEQAFFFTGRIPTAESAADDATDLPVYRRKYMNEGFGGGMDRGDSYGGYDDGDSYDSTAVYNGGQNIMPVYLSLQNPLIIDADQGYGAGAQLELRGSESPGELIARAKAEGHDGIIIRGKYRNYESIARINGNNWLSDQEKKKYLDQVAREDARKQQTDHYFIAFRPDQIKSAIGNIGAFGQRPVTAEEAERFGMGEMEAEYRQYEGDIRFSADRDYEPKKTVKAYKLFRTDARQPGKLFPLFVLADQAVPMGEWLRAEIGPMSGDKVKSKLGPLAFRPGWHAGDVPVATHIGMKDGVADKKPKYRNPEHVWAEVEFAADVDWQAEANKRGTNASGKLVPVRAHITDQLPVGGFYRYKTNPNMEGTWLIGGEMKVNRVLSDSEVKRINDKAGTADLPRKEPLDLKAKGFPAGRPTLRKSEDRVTETPEFKRWFGDSKVVDAEGQPLVVYHATNSRDISKFRMGANEGGAWFAADPEVAEYFGEAALYPVYLSIQNPLPDGKDGDKILSDAEKRWPGKTNGELLRLLGYDGLSFNELDPDRPRGAKGTTWMVVSPEQIKSAIGNSGAFDPTSPDITKSADRPWFDDLSKLKVSTNYQLGDLLKTSKKLSWWDRTVGTQYGIAQKHPQFKRVFDAVQTFINDVSAYATRAADLAPTILPKLETLKDIAKSPLSAEDVKALRDPIFGGTLKYTRDDEGNIIEADDVSTAGVVFTNDELRDLFGLNDRQVKLYREFRRATNKSLTDLAVSDMLRYLGTDGEGVRQRALEAPNLDGALNAMVAHLDQLIEQQPKRAEVLEDTKRAIKEKAGQAIGLMARGYAPLSRFGQYTVYAVGKDGEQIYFSMFENERDANKMAREMREQYPEATVTTGTMSTESYKLFSGVTPETLALFGESLGLEESGVDAKSEVFQQYLKMAKTNRSAMKRLIQRKGIDGFSEDAGRVLAGFVYSNARQISTNLHAGEISRSAAAVTDGDVKDAAIRLMEYVQNPMEEAQAIRGLMFTQFIGGSIASAMVNMTQPFTMTLPYLSQFDGATGAAKRMADAVKLVSRGVRNDEDLQKALKRAEQDGVVSPQEVHQLMAQAQGKGSLQAGDGTKVGDAAAKVNNAMAKLGLVWGKLFSAAEQFNRRVTFIAAYKMARERGMENPFAFAEKAIAETQGVYNKGNKPKWARGAVGSTLFTFKQYSIAYMEFLVRMWGNGPEGKKAVGLALAVLFLTAGLSGLPGMDDLDDVIDGFMQRVLGKSFDSKQAKKEFFASILGQAGAEFVMSGLSGLPGVPIDIAGRMGLGNLFPGTGLFTKKRDYARDYLEIVGPAGTLFANAGAAVANVAQGEFKKAAEALAPVAAQNALKAIDMAQMGYYRDVKGRKVVDTDGFDAVAKAIGFQPRAVAQVQDATGTLANLIAQNKLRETEIADKWAQGRIERNPAKVEEAKQELADWNRKNPQSPIRIDQGQINKRVQEANKTKAQRVAATAPKELRGAAKKQLEAELND